MLILLRRYAAKMGGINDGWCVAAASAHRDTFRGRPPEDSEGVCARFSRSKKCSHQFRRFGQPEGKQSRGSIPYTRDTDRVSRLASVSRALDFGPAARVHAFVPPGPRRSEALVSSEHGAVSPPYLPQSSLILRDAAPWLAFSLMA